MECILIFQRNTGNEYIHYLLVDRKYKDEFYSHRIVPRLNTITLSRLRGCVQYALTHYGEYIYILGGKAKLTGKVTNRCWRYNLASGMWKSLPEMLMARANCTSHCTYDGRVYILGGEIEGGEFTSSVECYDPDDNEWYDVNSMPGLRCMHHSILLQKPEMGMAKIIVSGGVGSDKKPTNTFWSYNTERDVWHANNQADENMPNFRKQHKMACCGKSIYVMTGMGVRTRRGNAVEMGLDLIDTFTHPDLLTVDIPGKRKPEVTTDDTQCSIKFSFELVLNIREGTWTTEEEVLQQCRTGADVIVIDDCVYVIGGRACGTQIPESILVQCYDTLTNTWLQERYFSLQEGLDMEKEDFTDVYTVLAKVPLSNDQFNNDSLAITTNYVLW